MHIIRDDIQLRNMIQLIATLLEHIQAYFVVFRTCMCRIQLQQMRETCVPGAKLIGCICDGRDRRTHPVFRGFHGDFRAVALTGAKTFIL